MRGQVRKSDVREPKGVKVEEHAKAAFESAADTAKQLITLATAVLALEITFAKDLIDELGSTSKAWLGASWLVLLLSVVAGVWTMLALTGSLGKNAKLTPEAIFASNIRAPAMIQVLLFVAGLILTVCFGLLNVW